MIMKNEKKEKGIRGGYQGHAAAPYPNDMCKAHSLHPNASS